MAGEAAHQARNRRVILAFEFMWGVAMPFVLVSTVLPGYLRHLGVANVWIGLAPALHNGAISLIQPLSAYAIPPGVRRLGRMRLMYLVAALAYVGLGAAILIGLSGAVAGLIAALLAELLFSLAVGAGDPHYMELANSATTPSRRGRFFGLRAVALGCGGILGGEFAARLLRSTPPPHNFGWSLTVGGLLYVLSLGSMMFYREVPARPAPLATRAFGAYFRERILGQARSAGFKAYLAAVILFSTAACGFPFLALLLKERLADGDELFGTLGALFMGCNLLLSWVLGTICDRWGARFGFAFTLLLYAAGVAGCLCLEGRAALYAAYLVAGVWLPGQLVAVTDLALRLAARSSAAEVTATMMLAMTPSRILGPIAVGAAIDRWGYGVALGACAASALLALVALWWSRPACAVKPSLQEEGNFAE